MDRMTETMTETFTPYDPANVLQTDDDIAVFIDDALQTGDSDYLAKALGVVTHARGMAQIASQTGLSREQLDHSFGERGNPTLKTTMAVMKALGVQLTARHAA